MINLKKGHVFLCVGLLLSGMAFAQTVESYRIDTVIYDITGSTREYPLTQAVTVDTESVFTGKEAFESYIADLTVLFTNQRVFESATLEPAYGSADSSGVIPVTLTVHTKDTWNIIVLPYPKYDSNDGFEFKLKLKNYNFFGSMQVLNGDLNYSVDNDKKSSISAGLDFEIPFKAWGYELNWSNEVSVKFPEDEIAQFDAMTGMSIKFPVRGLDLIVGVEQSIAVNDRDSDEIYVDDPLYFNERVYAKLPVTLYKFQRMGKLTWTPSTSLSANWFFSPIDHPDLQGPVATIGHSLDIGRVDWVINFRHGVSASIGNSYEYNIYKEHTNISVDGSLAGFTSFFDRVGLTGRMTGIVYLNNDTSDTFASKLRGILDKRIKSDAAITLNIDLPIRILRVDFLEVTGVSWTRAVGFEMHLSPFFDMALTNDPVTGRFMSLKDGWYSGGMEIIIYPAKMRSIYGRISAGWDLIALSENGGALSGRASRDDASIRELLLGIGLHY